MPRTEFEITSLSNSDGNETTHRKELVNLSEIPIIMPIGGLATRAKEITQDLIPKHLIRIGNDLTVLDLICLKLQEHGFRKFIFCLGHHKEQLLSHISQENWIEPACDIKYEFSTETKPLGPDGAVYHALCERNITQPVVVMPGDMFLPWQSFPSIIAAHKASAADITFGLTSYITPRTTDVGKIIIDSQSRDLLKCYRRDEQPVNIPDQALQLTSAGMGVLNPNRFVFICQSYLRTNGLPDDYPLSIRDNLLPWMENNCGFSVKGYDLKGEALDLGTPNNIIYGLANWSSY